MINFFLHFTETKAISATGSQLITEASEKEGLAVGESYKHISIQDLALVMQTEVSRLLRIPESSVMPSLADESAIDNSAEQASSYFQFHAIAIQEFHAARSRAREARKTRLQTGAATAVTIVVSILSAVALIVTNRDALLTGLILVGLMLGGFGLSLTTVRAIRTVLKDHCEVLEAQLNATRLYELVRRYAAQQKKNEIMILPNPWGANLISNTPGETLKEECRGQQLLGIAFLLGSLVFGIVGFWVGLHGYGLPGYIGIGVLTLLSGVVALALDTRIEQTFIEAVAHGAVYNVLQHIRILGFKKRLTSSV